MNVNIKQNITLPSEDAGLKKSTLLLQEMAERRNALSIVVKEKNDALKAVPDGRLRVQKRQNSYQYYLRNDPKDINGKYIPKKDHEIAIRLAQKEYDRTILN